MLRHEQMTIAIPWTDSSIVDVGLMFRVVVIIMETVVAIGAGVHTTVDHILIIVCYPSGETGSASKLCKRIIEAHDFRVY